MKPSIARVEAVSWPVSTGNASRRWSTREGLRLVLRDELGHEGAGVAAPLVGYAPDDLTSVRASFAESTAWLDVPSDPADVPTWLPARLETIGSPAARFAIETALVALIAKRTQTSELSVLGGAPKSWDAAALIETFDEGAAEEAVRRGFSTVKLKVGHAGRLEDEVAAVRRASSVATVRIDANGSLDETSVRAFEELPIELIEEPGAPTTLPIALDESLRTQDPWGPGVVAVVLKPMVLGGVLACAAIAGRAAAHGVEAIASHTFDGPEMHEANIRLAHILPKTRFAHGVPR